ncbi:MAG: alkaline phosphatase family protein [Anaerolineales bacterium]|nr:alkaline phosphatase family protein [Anaerolineales bacterium]
MKVILVLSDALRDDIAAQRMGYLEHLVETHLATRYSVRGELPTLSRPMYETVHTGLLVSQHGVVSNQTVRRSTVPNIFEEAVKHKRTTAAAAYYWISELYNRAPFDPVEDREVDDVSLPIQHGRFYMEDDYPDKELFLTAALLVRRNSPDYLLIHPMGMDYTGERYGSDTPEYRNHATYQDMILANLIPEWLQAGYTVLVTGDHGINADHAHGGTTPDVRMVPLYIIPPQGGGKGDTQAVVSQLQIAPTVCSLLGIPIPKTMTEPVID